jgi:hypothetical protein
MIFLKKINSWLNAEDVQSDMGFGIFTAIFRHLLMIILLVVLFFIFIVSLLLR